MTTVYDIVDVVIEGNVSENATHTTVAVEGLTPSLFVFPRSSCKMGRVRTTPGWEPRLCSRTQSYLSAEYRAIYLPRKTAIDNCVAITPRPIPLSISYLHYLKTRMAHRCYVLWCYGNCERYRRHRYWGRCFIECQMRMLPLFRLHYDIHATMPQEVVERGKSTGPRANATVTVYAMR